MNDIVDSDNVYVSPSEPLNPDEHLYFYERFKDLLNRKVLYVMFEKADGSFREMFASTNQLYIPGEYHGKELNSGDVNTDIVRVIDVELGQWRSIRVDSIMGFSLTDRPVLESTKKEEKE